MKCRPDYVFPKKADRCVIDAVCSLKYCKNIDDISSLHFLFLSTKSAKSTINCTLQDQTDLFFFSHHLINRKDSEFTKNVLNLQEKTEFVENARHVRNL